MQRSETILSLAIRSVQNGKYTEALNILNNNFIEESEGAREKQDTYINAHTLRSIEYFNSDKYENALNDLDSALAYPIGNYGRSLYAQLYYLEGIVYQKMGNTEKAEEFFKKTLETEVENRGNDSEYKYYHGLALQMLGKLDEAKTIIFNDAEKCSRQKRYRFYYGQFSRRGSQQSEIAANHYMIGLAYEGLGEKEKAKKNLTRLWKLTRVMYGVKQHLSTFINNRYAVYLRNYTRVPDFGRRFFCLIHHVTIIRIFVTPRRELF
jgi:tetratricopeptide (TPR) repeat protein